MSHSWDDMQDRLIELVGEGRTASDIADQLNKEFVTKVSRNAVIGRCFRLNLSLGAGLSRAQKDDVRLRLQQSKATGEPLRAKGAVVKKRHVCFEAPQVRAIAVPVVQDVSPALTALVALTPDRHYGPSSILDIRQDQCRFIAGAPSGFDPCMCGMKVKPLSSYCESHHARVYVRSRTPEERKADEARRLALRRSPAYVTA